MAILLLVSWKQTAVYLTIPSTIYSNGYIDITNTATRTAVYLTIPSTIYSNGNIDINNTVTRTAV